MLGASVDADSLSRCPSWSAVASATIPSWVMVTGGRFSGTGDATGGAVVGAGRQPRPEAGYRWDAGATGAHTVRGRGSGMPDSATRRRRRAPPGACLNRHALTRELAYLRSGMHGTAPVCSYPGNPMVKRCLALLQCGIVPGAGVPTRTACADAIASVNQSHRLLGACETRQVPDA